MSAFFVLAQAAAEYGVTTARQMSGTPARNFQQAVDDARTYVSDHTFMVVLGAIVLFVILRFFFTAPRVH